MAGAAVTGDTALVADIPTWGEGNRVTREELGRATWLFLHTLAAQYPDDPTRQQARDVRDLISVLTRAYPCAECASHFDEVVRRVPPVVSSGAAFRQWACEVHNEVNARLGKPRFDCAGVDTRWPGLECAGEGEEDGCAVRGRSAVKANVRGSKGVGGRGEGRRRLGMNDP
jgi:FAD-linked sulfhydryl oxidase